MRGNGGSRRGGREREENRGDDKSKDRINLLQTLRGPDETKRHNGGI